MKNIGKIILILFTIALLGYLIIAVVLFVNQEKLRVDANKQQLAAIHEDSLKCICNKKIAREYLKRDFLIAHNSGEPYFKDIVLHDFNLYSAPISKDIREIMDSALFAKYGKDFYKRIRKKSDSLYKINSNIFIDFDGYHTAALKEPRYKCGDVNGYYNYIEDRLISLNLLPLKQDPCLPNELVIDAVITKTGKLIKVRVLKGINPIIDRKVVCLLNDLPCNWIPAYADEEEIVDFRKTFYFFFEDKLLKESHPECFMHRNSPR